MHVLMLSTRQDPQCPRLVKVWQHLQHALHIYMEMPAGRDCSSGVQSTYNMVLYAQHGRLRSWISPGKPVLLAKQPYELQVRLTEQTETT